MLGLYSFLFYYFPYNWDALQSSAAQIKAVVASAAATRERSSWKAYWIILCWAKPVHLQTGRKRLPLHYKGTVKLNNKKISDSLPNASKYNTCSHKKIQKPISNSNFNLFELLQSTMVQQCNKSKKSMKKSKIKLFLMASELLDSNVFRWFTWSVDVNDTIYGYE